MKRADNSTRSANTASIRAVKRAYSNRWVNVAALALCLGAVGFTSCGGRADPIASTPAAARPRMLAYYYLWWSDRHWAEGLGEGYPLDAVPQPLPARLGPTGCGLDVAFDRARLADVDQPPRGQDTPGVIEQDVRDAVSAGLDGFVVNWAGTGESGQRVDDSSYSRRLDALVRAVHKVESEGADFTLWFSYKGSATVRTVGQITNDLGFLERTYARDTAFDRSFGRAVLVFTGSRKYPIEQLRSISERFRRSFYIVGDENGRSWTSERAALFDGDHYYWSSQNPYSNRESFAQLEALSARVRSAPRNRDGSRKGWFAPLSPGYDSTLIGGSTCVPRNGGETLRRIYRGNASSAPDAWILISWNEIAEGTYVQPLTRYGREYLDRLRELRQ